MKFPDKPKKGVPVEKTVNEIIDFLKATAIVSTQGAKLKQTGSGQTLVVPRHIPRPQKKPTPPPFFPYLIGNAEDGFKLAMEKGWVVSWVSDGVSNIDVIDIPGQPDRIDNAMDVIVGDKFVCKLTESTDGLITAAAVEKSSSWPTSTAAGLGYGGAEGYRYIRLCEVKEEEDRVYVLPMHTGHIDHFQSANTFHPWKVSYAGEDDWTVVGDTVYSQGDPIIVADTTVSGTTGYVVLKITRDSTSREITAAVVEFATEVTASYYTDQYRVLAKVGTESTPKVVQLQFEEIRILEDRVLVNGESKLVGLEVSHRNNYDLPTP
jgi:hypothetical protein